MTDQPTDVGILPKELREWGNGEPIEVEKIYAAADLIERLDREKAELEKEKTNIANNAVKMMTPDCNKHTGENTPPWPEFHKKYAGRCIVCDVERIEELEWNYDAACATLETRDREIEELEAQLNSCKTCGGTGEVDDAEPGDIGYNTYVCPDCKGKPITTPTPERNNGRN